ncbi:MAG TPA: HDOD domain-containing protein [Gammaproteobacteria bacterium]|nr:HDOD domain-containing protein [Gammaproteobacteria bacterium]
MEKRLQNHLARFTNLPSLPGVALRIIELSQDREVKLGKMAEVVSLDPALAAKILRVANSPLYARRRGCANLRQALALLGLNAAQNLALSFSLVSDLLRRRNGVGLDYPRFWKRSLLAALSARALAARLRLPNSEEVFLAALLQDVGMLALDKGMPELYRGSASSASDHEAVRQCEFQELATDHAQIGATLLKAWNLPERLQQGVAASHDPDAVTAQGSLRTFLCAVAVSGRLADVWIRQPREPALADAVQCAGAWLGLAKADVLAAIDSVRTELPEIEALFEIDLVGTEEAEAVLEQAREVLTIRNVEALQEALAVRADIESLETQTRELEEKSRRDALTGLYNRSHLNRVLAEEFRQASEQNWPLSVAFIDLDHFKRVNDTFGHQAGDRVLIQLARMLESEARDTDLLARYGGEEFVLVLAGCGAAAAHAVSERIAARIARSPLDLDEDQQVTVTLSIGIATHGEAVRFDSAEDLIRSSDRALYAAKLQGRNRVVRHDPSIGGASFP